MKMKKLLVAILISSMAVGLFAGCGSSTTKETAAPTGAVEATSTPTEKTEINLWHYYSTEGSQLKFQEYIDEFNAQSETTTVKVTVLPFADFKTQLTIGAAADSLPDLAMIDNCDCVAYAAMGMFEDITDVVSGWENTKNYFPEILGTCKFEDRIYALPLESNNLEIIYNKDMLAEAGVEPPTNFEELIAAAKACTTDEHYGFALSGVESEESTYQFLPFFWAAGGETMDLNSEAGKKVLSMFTDMINEGSMPKECISWTQSELASQFTSGNLAMHVMGNWQLTNYKNKGINYGVCPIPSDVTTATVYGGENLAVIKGKHTENATEFLKWFLDYERNSEWNLYIDHFVASESTLTDANYQSDEWKAYIDMIPNSRARDVTPNWPEISVGYQKAIQGALSGVTSVDEALSGGQKIIDEANAQ
ncbi:MAG: sugar ABC transporter substrate-binding protein [Lachnospiraceae bacterium]|nr:sugar ABC transporter substrate-binding protein [Lachnospiraceae bacterium]